MRDQGKSNLGRSPPRVHGLGFHSSRSRVYGSRLWTLRLSLGFHVSGRCFATSFCDASQLYRHPKSLNPDATKPTPITEARKLEHHYPHALKVKYKGS